VNCEELKKDAGEALNWLGRHWKFVFVVVALGVLVVITQPSVDFGINFGDGETEAKANSASAPAEFLYLDTGRVDAYLAQLEGGSYESEKQIEKLSSSLKANLKVANTIEGGGESEQEHSEEREIKPTEASRFLTLVGGLAADEELAEPTLANSEWGDGSIGEGQFVRFRTPQLTVPDYLKPYLASRRAVAALAHNVLPSGNRAGFLGDLGREPRAVLALHSDSGAVLLMPVQGQLLSGERSLIKFGGGKFTVVGKVVRAFPEEGDEQEPVYEDSATREVWERALAAAPGGLLCRSDRSCAKATRSGKLDGAERQAEITDARRQDREALHTETMIEERGAVILPIAIYK
jgi:hypothetical protein